MEPPAGLEQELRRIEEEAFGELKQLVDDARLDMREGLVAPAPLAGDAASRLAELEKDVAEVARELMSQTFRRSTLALQRHLQEQLQGPDRKEQEQNVWMALAQTARTGLLDGALTTCAEKVEAEFADIRAEIDRQGQLAVEHGDRWADRVAGSGKLGLEGRPGMSVLTAAVGRLRMPLADIVADLRSEDRALQDDVVERTLRLE